MQWGCVCICGLLHYKYHSKITFLSHPSLPKHKSSRWRMKKDVGCVWPRQLEQHKQFHACLSQETWATDRAVFRFDCSAAAEILQQWIFWIAVDILFNQTLLQSLADWGKRRGQCVPFSYKNKNAKAAIRWSYLDPAAANKIETWKEFWRAGSSCKVVPMKYSERTKHFC